MKPHPFKYTVFPTLTASAMQVREVESFDAFCALLKDKPDTYERKADMPLLCPMLFSGERSSKNALRSNDTVIEIWGVCGDHDAGSMTVDDAAARLAQARVECLLYTTASHTPGAPRWRVVAPFVAPTKDVGEHLAAVERLNFILDGALKPESFTLSQSFYFGRVKGVEYQTRYVKGRGIDTLVKVERKPKSASIINLDARREQMKLPVLGGSIEWPGLKEELKRRLRHVPSGTGRERWLAIGMGIHHACGGSLEGFEIWHAWSAGANDTSYKGYEDCLYQWKSFKTEHKTPRQWGTVRHYLDEFDPPKEYAPLPSPHKLPVEFMVDDLDTMDIPATEWLVEGLIAPGLTLFAAPPKQGKSYLSLQMGLCVAAGVHFLGRATKACRVTYFDLEEWHALLKERVTPIKLGNCIPKGVPLSIRLESGVGPEALKDMAAEIAKGSKLLIVDLLARIRDEMSEDAKKNVYARDMKFVGMLAGFALGHPGVAIVVIHHGNKGNHDDWQNKISGSAGMAGASHCNLYMQRPNLQGMTDEADKQHALQYRVLHANGKQVKEQDITLEMMDAGGGWQTSALKPWEISTTRKQARILTVLRARFPAWVPTKEVATTLGLTPNNVRQMMYQMVQQGVIESDGRGGDGYRAKPGP